MRILTALILLTVLQAGCGVEQRLSVFDEKVEYFPRLAFISPGTNGASADDSYELQVSFYDIDGSESWNLFYLSDASENKGGTIQQGLPVSKSGVMTVSWATADMPSGTYYLHGELHSGRRSSVASADGPLFIRHGEVGNMDPNVSLSSPNGGELIEIGSTFNITFTASDADGDSLNFSIEFSRDAGTTWAVLANNVTSSPYLWQVTESFPEGNNYRIRIRATDQNNASVSDVSDSGFSIFQPVNWSAVIKPIFEESCGGASCHSSSGAFSSTFVSDQYSTDGGKGVSQMTDRIIARSIDTNTMPPPASGYPLLSESDKTKFFGWINEGKRQD